MKVYNTLSGQKEEFSPQGDVVKMYVCGVTPYSDAHLGHAMSYIIFEVIRRYLQFRGYKVKYVQNVTDIDDKIIDRANRLGVPARELAEKFTGNYRGDMKALNIESPDENPYATDVIPDMIEVIQGLIDKGYAYPVQGSVYFRVRNVPDYGKLSRRSLESMKAGARIEVGEEKEDPMDFVLWKASKPGEPAWDSPWGPGRPGWHIECSAMSLKYLGNTLDIHGGGQDLIFPHHENEIAQSESFTGVKPFVKYWLHNGLVQLSGEKMSKSLGNLITIKEALTKYSADAIRIFVLSSHYRSPLTYSEEIIEASERGAERLRQAAYTEAKEIQIYDDFKIQYCRQRFADAMDDDFGTPQALASLFDLAREINRASDEGHTIIRASQVLIELAGVLGLTLEKPEELSHVAEKAYDLEGVFNDIQENPALERMRAFLSPGAVEKTRQAIAIFHQHAKEHPRVLAEPIEKARAAASKHIVDLLVSLRDRLRQAKQFQLADEIRAKLDELGIVLEDTPKGTVWKRKK
ncbi:cysteine--tRNA ligase [Chloroflexota bacterium]